MNPQARLFFAIIVAVGGTVVGEEKGNSNAARPVLDPGKTAAEWELKGWTDGRHRKLSDHRGKVVVLDFWGVWCGPCIRMVPALKQLAKKYEKQDVVFLSIHTAGEKQSTVISMLKKLDWSIPAGLDSGTKINDGETARRYGVRGYPTLVVIDRQGIVSYNSSQNIAVEDRAAAMKKMEAMAKKVGLPWPIQKGVQDDKELAKRMNRLAVYMYGIEIDRALKKK